MKSSPSIPVVFAVSEVVLGAISTVSGRLDNAYHMSIDESDGSANRFVIDRYVLLSTFATVTEESAGMSTDVAARFLQLVTTIDNDIVSANTMQKRVAEPARSHATAQSSTIETFGILFDTRARKPNHSFGMKGQGPTRQMSLAYSATVRSLENFAELDMFRIALRDHSSRSAYKSRSLRSASRYDLRSARCI